MTNDALTPLPPKTCGHLATTKLPSEEVWRRRDLNPAWRGLSGINEQLLKVLSVSNYSVY